MKKSVTARPNPKGKHPKISGSAYVDPTALLIGRVIVGDEVFIGPGAVLRADEPGSSIEIGRESNVQDGVIIHALESSSVIIGNRVSLAHGCIVHGPCKVEDGCFVGFGSVLFGASVGSGTVIRHLVVVQGVEVGLGKLVASGSVVDTPEKAERLMSLDEETREFARKVVDMNLNLSRAYRKMSGG